MRDTLSHFSGVERMMSEAAISELLIDVSPVTSTSRRFAPNLMAHS